jgi:hypothetical protein
MLLLKYFFKILYSFLPCCFLLFIIGYSFSSLSSSFIFLLFRAYIYSSATVLFYLFIFSSSIYSSSSSTVFLFLLFYHFIFSCSCSYNPFNPIKIEKTLDPPNPRQKLNYCLLPNPSTFHIPTLPTIHIFSFLPFQPFIISFLLVNHSTFHLPTLPTIHIFIFLLFQP